MRNYLICFLSVFVLASCSKKTESRVTGKLSDLRGFDGCSWVITLDENDSHGNRTLEPGNLNLFNLDLKDGQKVIFSYSEDPRASICMVGTTVKLITIKKRD